MESSECPLPEVAEALKPFIRTRQEATAIRQEQHRHLEKHLQDENVPLTAVNLTLPLSSELEDPPVALSGVRLAYWKALKAHINAQAKYDALRTGLDQLKHAKDEPSSIDGGSPVIPITESYIPLLRQKETLRKLKVLDKALGEIESAGKEVTTTSLDEAVKTRVGEGPMPPKSPLTLTQSPEVETRLLKLKRALITTKRQADEHRALASTPSTPNGTSTPSPKAETAALQKALQELTLWMETQLATIANAEPSPPTSPSSTTGAPTPSKPAPTPADITALYHSYLAARRTLIATAAHPPTPPPTTTTTTTTTTTEPHPTSPTTSRNTNATQPPPQNPALTLLPHLPPLTHHTTTQSTALHLTSHIRRHLGTATTGTDNLFARLAGESHLVSASAGSGAEWADAGAEAGREVKREVLGRVREGERGLREAGRIGGEMRGLPGLVGGLGGRRRWEERDG